MELTWERIAGNFIVGFATAFAAISMVDGLPQDNKLVAGAIGGIIQGLLAAGKEMLAETEGGKKGHLPLLTVF